jgi:hypothetical protein
MERPNSVIVVAVVEFLGSALAAFWSVVLLFGEISSYFQVKRALENYGPSAPIRYDVLNPLVYVMYIFFLLLIGLMGMASSIGLLRKREWARKWTILLATIPVSVCVLLVILRPKALFPPDPGNGALLVVGGGVYLVLFMYLLNFLIPISIWFRKVLTRESVRSQFR